MDTSWHPGEALTPLEEEMRAKAAAGELVDRGTGPFNLAAMGAWGEERTARSAVLRHLLIGDDWPVDAKGVRLRGVRVIGRLDLDAATLRCPLSLDSCYLDASESVCLDQAIVPRLIVTRCHLPGLAGLQLSARQVDLTGSTLTGPLVMAGADISGQLLCRGMQLTGRDGGGYALAADVMKVGGDVLLEGIVASAGAIRLSGADITGVLNCAGAQVTGRYSGGNALVAEGMKVGGNVFLNGLSVSDGAVRLPGADISGQLNCAGAQLTGQDSESYALLASGMKVGGHVLIDAKFAAAGAVRLSGADITGQLNCREAQLNGRDQEGHALLADGVKVGGPVLMERACTSAGAVRLSGADITGQLACRGAQLTGRDNIASALIADGMHVGGDVFLDEKFAAAGTIVLRSSRVGGSVVLCPAPLAGEDHVALSVNATQAQITGRLVWTPAEQVSGQVNLEGATVSQLEDVWNNERPNGFWPTDGQLRLDGFTYGRFGGNQQANQEQRLAWIRSQYWRSGKCWQGYVSQPYQQLAAVYRNTGQDSQARKVTIARRTDLRWYGNLNLYRKVGNWLLDRTVRYGYELWRTAIGLAALFVIFTMLSVLAQHQHLLIPAGAVQGLHPVPSVTECTSSYPCFVPAGYAVDTVIPIFNVHQADYWAPDGSSLWGLAFVYATGLSRVLGWAATTLLIATYLTGPVRLE